MRIIELEEGGNFNLHYLSSSIFSHFHAVEEVGTNLLPTTLLAIKKEFPVLPLPIDFNLEEKLLLNVRKRVRRALHVKTVCKELNIPDSFWLYEREETPAFVLEALRTTDDMRNPARTQGACLLTNEVHTLLLDQLHAGNNLLDENYELSVFKNFWLHEVLPYHGVVGVAIAFSLWRRYLDHIFPRVWQHEVAVCLAKHQNDLSSFRRAQLRTIMDVEGRKKVEKLLFVLAQVLFKIDLDQQEICELVKPYLQTKLAPYVWTSIVQFGDASDMLAQIMAKNLPMADIEQLDPTITLALAIQFENLQWNILEKMCGNILAARALVAKAISNNPHAIRLSWCRPLFRQAAEKALAQGLVAKDKGVSSSDALSVLPPNKLIGTLQKEFVHYTRGSLTGLGA